MYYIRNKINVFFITNLQTYVGTYARRTHLLPPTSASCWTFTSAGFRECGQMEFPQSLESTGTLPFSNVSFCVTWSKLLRLTKSFLSSTKKKNNNNFGTGRGSYEEDAISLPYQWSNSLKFDLLCWKWKDPYIFGLHGRSKWQQRNGWMNEWFLWFHDKPTSLRNLRIH